jgi:hypothetical protein
VKAQEMPNVGGSTIHMVLGKILEKECMGGCGMLCAMCVCDLNLGRPLTNFKGLKLIKLKSFLYFWKDFRT